MSTIKKIWAREILDSRGNPTVEVEITTTEGVFSRASVPSGASTGVLEAVELRDGGKRYGGKGVLKAVENVKTVIAPALIKEGFDVSEQEAIDKFMIGLDGTKNKAKLGANAILGVSIAVAKAAAAEKGVSIVNYLSDGKAVKLPVPLFNVLNGGEHSSNNVDMQEYKIAPIGASSFSEALEMAAETYHELAKLLKKDGYATTLGDEGGFAPDFRPTGNSVGQGITDPNELPLAYIVEAIKKAGHKPARSGKGAIAIFLDPATSSFDYSDGGKLAKEVGEITEGPDKGLRNYELRWSMPNASKEERTITTRDLLNIYTKWVEKYPIASIEDPVSEFDWAGMKLFNDNLGDKIQIMGDDIFVTNPEIIKRAIADDIANSTLIKLNQIGTLSETKEAVRLAKDANWTTVFSHRSGETEDSVLADITVAFDGQQLKTGAPARSERLAKYNQLLRIEEELGSKAVYAGESIFYNVKNYLK